MDGWTNRWTNRRRTVHRYGQILAVKVHLLSFVFIRFPCVRGGQDSSPDTGDNCDFLLLVLTRGTHRSLQFS